MSSRSTLARTLAGALAIGALAAPAALARPAGPDWPAGNIKQAPLVQNLRTPDAASQVAQGAGAAAAQGRYYASYGNVAPLQQPAQPVVADDGTPWMAIAAGFAALLILVGSVTLAGRAFMRTRRTGATV